MGEKQLIEMTEMTLEAWNNQDVNRISRATRKTVFTGHNFIDTQVRSPYTFLTLRKRKFLSNIKRNQGSARRE